MDRQCAIEALKTTIAYGVATGIVLWMHWPEPVWVGFTVIMLRGLSIGSSIINSTLRLLGTIIGGLVGLLLLDNIIQNRALYITSLSMWISICAYLASDSPTPFGYIFAAVSAAMVSLEALSDPVTKGFYYFQYRTSEVSLGIVCVLLVGIFLWPNHAGKTFIAQLKQILIRCQKLFHKRIICYMHHQLKAQHDYREQIILTAVGELPQKLLAATKDTFHIANQQNNYRYFIDTLSDLLTNLNLLHESLKQDRQYLLHASLKDELLSICKQIDAALIQVNQIKLPLEFINIPKSIFALPDNISEQLTILDKVELTSPYQKALLMTIRNKLIDCAKSIATVGKIIQTISDHKTSPQHPRLKNIEIIYNHIFQRERLVKALKVGLVTAALSATWIFTNWPGGAEGVIIGILIAFINTIEPALKTLQIIQAFVLALASSFIVYFLALPHMSTLFGFYLAILPFMFVFNYIAGDPKRKIVGIVGAILFVSLINISNYQIYSFMTYSAYTVGIFLGVVISMMIIRLVWPQQAEKQFINHILLLLAFSKKMLMIFQEHLPSEARNKPILRSIKSKLMQLPVQIKHWQELIEPHDQPQLKPQQLDELLERLQMLTYRLESLEFERGKLIHQEAYVALRDSVMILRQRLMTILENWKLAIRGKQAFQTLPDLDTLFQQVDTELQALISQQHHQYSEESFSGVLSILNCYRGVLYAMSKCDEQLRNIDWPLLARTHF